MDYLKQLIDDLYEARHETRDDWADWLFDHHVQYVGEKSAALARKYSAREDLAEAMGRLHDIADAVMERKKEGHAEKSIEIARDLMQRSGFSDEDIETVADALLYHGCYDGNVPHTLEGRVFATADAVAHLQTDFYDFAHERFENEGRGDKFVGWLLPKIERDLNQKILFDEERELCRPAYDRLVNTYNNAGGDSQKVDKV